ncbi:hypothetical protein LPJ56_005416, partial [Coemansia sp. RSA 2599]
MLGNFSLGALLTIRSYKFYRVFCKNKPVHGYMRIVPYVLYIVLIIFVGLISTLVPRRMTMLHLDSIEFCAVNQDLVTTYSVMLWGMWGVYMVMMWLLRNVRSSFNEFKEMAISLCALVICTISNQALLYSVPLLPTVLHWRILLVAIDQFTANYIWWLIMLKPLYHCIFNHDSYLAYWKQKMTNDGLRAQYGMGAADTEHSINSATLVGRAQTSHSKNDKSDPSFTESTRLAISQLAALSESHGDNADSLDQRWRASAKKTMLDEGENYRFRRSMSFSQDFSRRKSEPHVSTGNASGQNERRSRYRMLTQCVLSYHDSDNRISSNADRDSGLQNALGVAGLQKDVALDLGQGNNGQNCTETDIVATTLPRLQTGIGFDLQSESKKASPPPSTLLSLLQRPDAHLANSDSSDQGDRHRWQHQQHSDTD